MPNSRITGRSKNRVNASLKRSCRSSASPLISPIPAFSITADENAARMPSPPNQWTPVSVAMDSEIAVVSSEACDASGREAAQRNTRHAPQPMTAPTAMAAPTSSSTTCSHQWIPLMLPLPCRKTSGSSTSGKARPSLAPLSALMPYRRAAGTAVPPGGRSPAAPTARVRRGQCGADQRCRAHRDAQGCHGNHGAHSRHQQHAGAKHHQHPAPVPLQPVAGQPHRRAGHRQRQGDPRRLVQESGREVRMVWRLGPPRRSPSGRSRSRPARRPAARISTGRR